MSLDYHVPTDPPVQVDHADRVTLVSLVRDVWQHKVFPVELPETYLESIAARDRAIEAFAFLDVESARAEARLRAQVLERGRAPGRLHGISIGIKDNIDVKGGPTKAGSEVTDRTPAAADAAVVAKLRPRGAVNLGRTTTHEFAYGVVSAPTKNPVGS